MKYKIIHRAQMLRLLYESLGTSKTLLRCKKDEAITAAVYAMLSVPIDVREEIVTAVQEIYPSIDGKYVEGILDQYDGDVAKKHLWSRDAKGYYQLL